MLLLVQKHLDFDVFMITLVVNQNYMTEATNEYVITGNSALMRCVIPSFVSDFISLQNWQDEKGNVMVPHTNNYGRQQQKTLRVICNCLIYTSLNNVNWVIKKLELVIDGKHQYVNNSGIEISTTNFVLWIKMRHITSLISKKVGDFNDCKEMLY